MTRPSQTDSSETAASTNENEYLLKLVASLEACNKSLLNKLDQAQRELAALRKPIAQTLPGTKSTDGLVQSYGWERKLTRTQWRPT